MTACNFRSLLLAAIVLSNCITWTASRHHYTHNVYKHRTRHRRQGAGLYLSASYVIPGGEGSGAWGEWGEISPCSRTCGGGVASQKRICLQIGPDGQPQCSGGDTKYFSCQTQDCPNPTDFRAEQCAEFDDQEFRGYKYNWVPYTKAPKACELNCMPHGERFYFRHKLKVTDGTRCNDDSFDVCVDGTCQPVGCDMMLGSNAREDKCRECRGNGANCRTTAGIIDSQEFVKGYNDVILIPQGSTTIIIEEVKPSNNYLALRAKNGTYYLNGHYHIDFPRSIMIAGALWTYERSQQGYAAPDKLRCLGPINEPLYLSLLLQDENVGIRYEYSVPKDSAPPTDKRYNWVHEDFTPCSATCGGGFQTRNVTCRSREELEVVDDGLCDEGLKPVTNQSCSPEPCPARWVEGPWGECSKRCGKGGVRSREVTCQKIIVNGYSSIVADKECFDLLGPKPELFQACNEDAPCPTWFIGNWKPCDKLCDEGKQTRQVVCYQKNNGRIEVLADEDCVDEKPQVEQSCILQPCEGVDWITTDWSGCDNCLSKNRTRVVICATKDKQVLNDSFCENHRRPADEEECDKEKLPPCEVQWYATQWSKCSVDCGDGVRTRKVFCGVYDGDKVEVVKDAKCADLPKYNETKPCTVPKAECPAQSFAGPWTTCTKKCGGGEQYRYVMCFQGDKVVPTCDNTTTPDWRACNTGPCDPDETLPVDSKTTPIMEEEDEDECEDEDYDTGYDEVGLDSDELNSTNADAFKSSVTFTDIALSDSPATGYAEHESSLESGSGFGSTTDDLMTTEGSGSSSLSTLEDTMSTFTSDTDYTTDTTDISDSSSTGTGETTPAAETKSSSSDTGSTSSSGASEKNSTGSTESNATEKTGSTSTDETGSTSSEETSSTGTGETDSTSTGETKTTVVTKAIPTSSETGSTESSATEETGSISTGETGSTSSDETGSTGTEETASSSPGSTNTEETESTSTGETKTTVVTKSLSTSSETGSTESSATEETGSTPTGETGSTSLDGNGSTSTGETASLSSGSTETAETVSTSPGETKSSSSDTGSTPSSGTGSKSSSGTSETGSTSSTESNATEETGSTSTGETGSTSSDETGSTGTGETSSGSTNTEETDSTITSETETTGPTESTPTGGSTTESGSTPSSGTGSTSSSGTSETGSTSSTESSATEETGSTSGETGSTSSDETGSTGIGETASSSSGSTDTEKTDMTSTGETKTTYGTRSMPILTTPSSETGSTESIATTNTEETESTSTAETKTTVVTKSLPTSSETGSTESSATDNTESTVTEETGSTESTVTEETESTETGSTETDETGSTGSTENTGSTPTTESGSTSTDVSSGSTVSTGTDKSSLSTESSASTELSLGSSESSGSESTTESGSTVSSSEISGATTVESSVSGSESSTVSGSTEESTTEVTGTSTSGTESPVTEISTALESETTSETTESGSTISSESSTEESEVTSTGSTEEGSTSESGSTPESTGTEGSTTEGVTGTGSTEVSGSTTEASSTSEVSPTEGVIISTGSTPWDFSTTVGSTKKGRVCKPRRTQKCSKSEFGCCPDKKTSAAGPFDKGCPKPHHTCKEARYGCCPDGLSPAQGGNNEGCPVEPCADTLFGCCLSDNKTAAQGNDQDGCPPPPPPCASSKFGCCADNETEAAGPEKQGCAEYETTTTAADTETTTATSEFSEGSTSSEGATDVTSSTTLELCSGYQYGCCPDNETEALGPDGQGCPCDTTEFGCCPDGVSPARGAGNEGCPGPCSTSTHGCCQDGKTPAHGPDYEGCCLLQAFGCCPDNRKPAEGPHLEGCGCQYALHGCCPDNVTIAKGPNNQGCGCQYTEHGCCPDWHTEATGPNNEGCGCNTFQFGCCADGVTIATGPEQQGCHCRDSTYGCCSDGETPATGPDSAGCDCSTSKYGCCPDGHSEATGPKFLGCTDAPENKQAVCSMSPDQGSCNDFTAMWFYDMAYGGCSRFWYGGCEGNGNRFATKEDCEDICVQPPPKDVCKLPEVKGACASDYVRWHYNSSREQCIPFRYGGCLGNANNFETRELCQAQCEPSKPADQCSLPIEQGSCAGNYSRWGFNTETHRCEQFIWGGCEGNANRFSTEAACQMRCDQPGKLKPQCTEQQEAGNCTEKEALWSFSQSENRCVPFYYTGCGGNGNRFDAREACEQTCPSAYVPDKCTLPYETGRCSNYRERWFYDTSINRCRQFYYGGCGGNENNFATEAECDNSCSELKIITTTARPTQPQPQPQPERPRQPGQEQSRPENCFYAIDSGPCTNNETKYAYDSSLGRCVAFQYGGCGGNQNNFPDESYCTSYCHPIQDICQLPMLSGPCEESLMRWFYDPSSDSCSQFTYGGCEGNDNRFESREACESRCRTGPAQTTLRTTVTTPAPNVAVDSRIDAVPPECRVPESLENCLQSGEVWFFDVSHQECVPHTNQVAGASCRHTGTFASQEACERSCGAFRGIDVCRQRVDPGPCQNYATKVYFDAVSGQCHEFAYGGCHGGANRFSTVEECSQVCKAEIDPCSLPPEQGNCFAYIQQWYFDSSRGQCYQFMYTGCSGNENRFETQQDCEARCRRPSTTTTVAPAAPPQQQAELLECITPSSLEPCGENQTVFYYDSERRHCLAAGIGRCGHPNSYRSEEECERRCGAFRGEDVCGAQLDPGPCRASIPKFYWDSITGTCQEYAYGGCNGGPNRFSTAEECDEVCGATGPAWECLQEVDTGVACLAAPAPRWHYSVAHADCIVFAYQGCGGNDNHFYSYDQCADLCIPRTRGTGANDVLPPDCNMLRQECEALVCAYGIDRVLDEGCQRCVCKEDPCIRANCGPSERCVAVAVRDPGSQEAQYSARCVAEHDNEVQPECSQYRAQCSSLNCEYGIQRTRTADGCESCACVLVDCSSLQDECQRIKCNYGVVRSVGDDGCERCRCKDEPCAGVSCAAGERCVVTAYRDAFDRVPQYTADCRPILKPGSCPMDQTTSNEITCHRECNDDADCRGVGKCCRRGCSDLCLLPAEPSSTAHPLFTTTYAPDVPAAPLALPPQEPNVAAAEGGKATLRCLFHGNPPPKITWRRGELTIDGSVGRYKLTSDGALEIISLYRNDTGVYICVADNSLGQARQEIHLVVNDPVETQVAIAGDENAVVTGTLGRPLTVHCQAYGYPQPTVFWLRGLEGTMVPYNDIVYEARGNKLLIRSLAIETLGEYTCQAYNGIGRAASWVVTVKAHRPEDMFIENQYLVPRYRVAPMAKTQPPTTRETTTTTTTTTTEVPKPLFTVPVSTHVSTPFSTLNIGAELRLTCEVDGHPEPEVYWTKDGARIYNDDRITISGSSIASRLAVSRVAVSDSGLYECHASNAYSSDSDRAQINVQQLVVPAKCTDNPFFANCGLIVHSKFCRHKYYSKFCCKSCVEAGQLDPLDAELQADEPFRRK